MGPLSSEEVSFRRLSTAQGRNRFPDPRQVAHVRRAQARRTSAACPAVGRKRRCEQNPESSCAPQHVQEAAKLIHTCSGRDANRNVANDDFERRRSKRRHRKLRERWSRRLLLHDRSASTCVLADAP
jgi:hypothetical protein